MFCLHVCLCAMYMLDAQGGQIPQGIRYHRTGVRDAMNYHVGAGN